MCAKPEADAEARSTQSGATHLLKEEALSRGAEFGWHRRYALPDGGALAVISAAGSAFLNEESACIASRRKSVWSLSGGDKLMDNAALAPGSGCPAPCTKRGELPFQGPKRLEARSYFGEVRLDHPVHVAAVPSRLGEEIKQ